VGTRDRPHASIPSEKESDVLYPDGRLAVPYAKYPVTARDADRVNRHLGVHLLEGETGMAPVLF